MPQNPTISCEPQDLLAAAAEYNQTRGFELEVIIYLLNQQLAQPKTVEELLEGARCMKCIPKGMQQEVQIYLLCQILNL